MLQALIRVLRGEGCWARMHWGKAGWPEWAPCFDGSQEYPDTWCDFGCAVKVQTLPDPATVQVMAFKQM